MEENRKTALITGASSGIGFELAKLFAKDGYNLALVGRNREQLMKIQEEFQKEYNIKVKICPKDLSISDTPELIFQSLRAEMIDIDILVNNAGFGWLGSFAEMDITDALGMLQVNIIALTQLTHLLLPQMIKRNEGKILNVASSAAFQPGPFMATYYASKAYVLSFSLALAEELKGTNITVTALCPGPTATNFGKRAGFNNEKIFGGVLTKDAQTIAMAGYKGLMKGKPLVIPGFLNWLGTQIVRFLPRTLPGKFIKAVQMKRSKQSV